MQCVGLIERSAAAALQASFACNVLDALAAQFAGLDVLGGNGGRR